uniref:Protein kinase domain-containing protein n=1 Tax=Arcella intermedia TaxID=1963864 RepID=A0A6B2L0T5_9EUKA
MKNRHKSNSQTDKLIRSATKKKTKKTKSQEDLEKAEVELTKIKVSPDEAPPPLINKHPYSEFPKEVQKKIEDLHIDKQKLEMYSDYLWTSARFVLKELFPDLNAVNNNVDKGKLHRIPYASEEAIEKAKKSILTTTKNMKKFYKSAELAGKGGFGSVFIAKEVATKKRVAVKKLPHDNERTIQNNYSEIAFLMVCQHPNIVQYHQTYLVDEKSVPEVWIIMEYMQGGTLKEASKSKLFTDTHIAYVAREMLRGLQYLHSIQLAHRDLKSANVMMSITGEIKLIDFGLCADFSTGPRTKMLGSPYWIPPEMIQDKPHSYPVDIWSFAVCLMELYISNPPYAESSLKCMFMTATKGLKDQIPKEATPDAVDFLSKCLVIDPDKRATAAQLLQHPWVSRKSVGDGVVEILKQIFLSNSLITLGF